MAVTHAYFDYSWDTTEVSCRYHCTAGEAFSLEQKPPQQILFVLFSRLQSNGYSRRCKPIESFSTSRSCDKDCDNGTFKTEHWLEQNSLSLLLPHVTTCSNSVGFGRRVGFCKLLYIHHPARQRPQTKKQVKEEHCSAHLDWISGEHWLWWHIRSWWS